MYAFLFLVIRLDYQVQADWLKFIVIQPTAAFAKETAARGAVRAALVLSHRRPFQRRTSARCLYRFRKLARLAKPSPTRY